MTTDIKTDVNEKSAVTFEEIWKNLVVTDERANRFQFSRCRNRHIVVLGSKKTANYIVGDIIRCNTYNYSYYQPRKEEQKTITYVMVQDDPSCNVCIINLIDIPPIENFMKRSATNAKDPLPSPMAEVDRAIYKFATYIDLIILVCEVNDFQLMKNMKEWAADRGHIMALVFIVDPRINMEEREKLILSIRENEEFRANELGGFFEKGIFCISDLSYNGFRVVEEQQTAQNYVKEWRSKFLGVCVCGPTDAKYLISLRDEKQSKHAFPCKLS